MISYSGAEDFLRHRTFARQRSIFWNLNFAISGVWVITSASILIHYHGLGNTKVPLYAPPIISTSPLYMLFTGVLMVVWPLFGIGISTTKISMVRDYVVASFLVFLIVQIYFTIGQLGLVDTSTISAGSAEAFGGINNSLVFMVCLLGPYFMFQELKAEKLEM